MKIRAVQRFTDREADKLREAGEEFEVKPDRYQKLYGLGLVEEVEQKKEKQSAKAEATEPKKED